MTPTPDVFANIDPVEYVCSHARFIARPLFGKGKIELIVLGERSHICITLHLDRKALSEIIGVLDDAIRTRVSVIQNRTRLYYEPDGAGYTLYIEKLNSIPFRDVSLRFSTLEEVKEFLHLLKQHQYHVLIGRKG